RLPDLARAARHQGPPRLRRHELPWRRALPPDPAHHPHGAQHLSAGAFRPPPSCEGAIRRATRSRADRSFSSPGRAAPRTIDRAWSWEGCRSMHEGWEPGGGTSRSGVHEKGREPLAARILLVEPDEAVRAQLLEEARAVGIDLVVVSTPE